jgi:hypothetical protein
MSLAPSTTWWFVTTVPSELSTMPVPAAVPSDRLEVISTSPTSAAADASLASSVAVPLCEPPVSVCDPPHGQP